MPKDGLQFLQFQRRGNTKYTLVTIETAIRDENVAVRIESEEVAEGLDGNDGAGDGIIFRNRILEKNLQGIPGATSQIGKELSIIQEVTTDDFRDTEYEMPVGNLLEYFHAPPLPEFHHALLMA
jgi:hypothetical protein